jgi:hypothetical protein
MFNTKFSSLGGKLNTNFSSSTNEFDSGFKESSVVKGEDGFSPIVSLSKDGPVTTLEITDKKGSQKVEILDGTDLTEEVNLLFQRLNSNATLGFYCVEDVDVVVNDVVTTYPANSNVEIKL